MDGMKFFMGDFVESFDGMLNEYLREKWRSISRRGREGEIYIQKRKSYFIEILFTVNSKELRNQTH